MTPTYAELLNIAIKQRDEYIIQCDEWRKVADLLAADLDDLTVEGYTIPAVAQFKELEKKYPL